MLLLPGNRVRAAAPTDVSARFPEPDRIFSDFTDDAERWAAFKILHAALRQAMPGPPVVVESGKLADYSNAMNDVDFNRRQQSATADEYERFSLQVRQLLNDPKFRDRVIARYKLNQLTDPSNSSGAREQDELDIAMQHSLPYWLGALMTVVVLAPIFVFSFDRRRLPNHSNSVGDSPVTLPDSLHVIRVFGRRYEVELHTGLVVDKESRTEHRVEVTATSGGPATVVGDQVYVSPTQIHAQTVVTQKDCLWVRGADGRESPWNLTNAALQARPGHVVSYVGRRLRNGGTEFLVATNHATGQVDTFCGLNNAHKARWFLACVATTFVGAFGILFAMYKLITSSGAKLEMRAMIQSANWTFPLIIAGFVAVILVGISASALRAMRNGAFKRRHLRAFKNFFDQNRAAFLQPFA